MTPISFSDLEFPRPYDDHWPVDCIGGRWLFGCHCDLWPALSGYRLAHPDGPKFDSLHLWKDDTTAIEWAKKIIAEENEGEGWKWPST